MLYIMQKPSSLVLDQLGACEASAHRHWPSFPTFVLAAADVPAVARALFTADSGAIGWHTQRAHLWCGSLTWRCGRHTFANPTSCCWLVNRPIRAADLHNVCGACAAGHFIVSVYSNSSRARLEPQ